MAHSRLRCPSCGTEQEAPESDATSLCEICGVPLSGGARGATIVDLDAADEPSDGDKKETLRELRTFEQMRNAPPSAAAPELAAVHAATKRGDFLLSLVPILGIWRLWRSEGRERERPRWTIASIMVTAAIAGGIIALLPSATDRARIANERVQSDFDLIAALVERYGEDAGRYPDAEVWNQTVARGDFRFLDPWNRPYRYRLEGDRFVLDTHGRDGEPGGTADDADLSRNVPRRDTALGDASP
ncbi:MAG: type II secretion system protein GspG [Candidatus Binatia bacterium]